jgi:hypothetical protein
MTLLLTYKASYHISRPDEILEILEINETLNVLLEPATSLRNPFNDLMLLYWKLPATALRRVMPAPEAAKTALRYPIETHSASIVLIGKFNPPIFSPAWFSKVGVLTDDEFEAASEDKQLVVHPEIAQFSTARFSVNVLPQRFTLSTPQESFVHILDDAVTIFRDKLPHTPMDKLGINYDAYWKVETLKQRTALGRALAPIKPWGAFGKSLESTTETKIGGLLALVMQQNINDGAHLYRRVQIEPWNSEKAQNGIRMQINDHYQLAMPKDDDGSGPIMKLLNDNFDRSLSQSKAIVSEMMEFASTVK